MLLFNSSFDDRSLSRLALSPRDNELSYVKLSPIGDTKLIWLKREDFSPVALLGSIVRDVTELVLFSGFV